MKGIRFYAEAATSNDKRKNKMAGNVVAVIKENRTPLAGWEAIGGVFEHPNSPVAGTSVSREYLASKCKFVSESKAREIHPELFKYLDRSELSK